MSKIHFHDLIIQKIEDQLFDNKQIDKQILLNI